MGRSLKVYRTEGDLFQWLISKASVTLLTIFECFPKDKILNKYIKKMVLELRWLQFFLI